MNIKDRSLYHQGHPIKLATDVSTAIVALWLLAQHQLSLALIVMFLPPVLVSLALVFFVDLRPIQVSGMGKYLHRYMTRAAEGVRFLGLAVMSVAAWQHRWLFVALGAALIIGAWTRGLFRPA